MNKILKKNNRFVSVNVMNIHFAGLLSLMGYLLLCLSSQSYGDLSLNEMMGFMMFVTMIWWGFYHFSNVENDSDAQFTSVTILKWALLFRVVALCTYPPLEDDIFRYLWDGFANLSLGGAYVTVPSQFYGIASLPASMDTVLDSVSYPDVPTVYGPFAQGLFSLAYFISPGNIFVLKALIIVFEVGLLVMLSRVLAPAKLFLISWCPLMIYQFSISAHVEVVSIAICLSAFLMHQTLQQNSQQLSGTWHLLRQCGLGALLALAVSAKATAIIIAPFLLYGHWNRIITFIVTLLMVYLGSYYFFSGFPMGLVAMMQDWQFNAFIFTLIQSLTNTEVAKLSVLIVFITLYAAIFFYTQRQLTDDHPSQQQVILAQAMTWITASFLLLSPVLNAWYWVWVLAFAVFTTQRWPWLISMVLFISYCTGMNLENWPEELALFEIPKPLFYIEYGLIFYLLIREGKHSFKWPGFKGFKIFR